jgi:hypothetical protein
MAFGAINAIQIKSIKKQTLSNRKDIMTHINKIQENHLKHSELEIASQNKIILNALRYNPAVLATTANQVVIKSSEIIIHKVKATIQQAQNNRLPKKLLQGDTVNKTFEFIVKRARDWMLARTINEKFFRPFPSGSVVFL